MKSRFKIHKPINVDTLVKRIGEHFGFTLSDLKGKRRTDAHVSCRFAVYHVLRKMLKMPLFSLSSIQPRTSLQKIEVGVFIFLSSVTIGQTQTPLASNKEKKTDTNRQQAE